MAQGKDKAANAAVELLKITGSLKKSAAGVPEGGKVESKTAYLIVLAKWTDTDEEKSDLLDEILSKKSMAILMGPEQEVMQAAGVLDCFKKNSPWVLALPILSARSLAEITLELVRQRGYVLRRNDGASDEMTVRMMEFIVRQTHDTSIIRERNAYLARDMLERAISRKNDRLEWSDSSFAARLVLTPMDFGVEMESEEQIAEKRQKIDREVLTMTGWSGEGSPKELFEKIKRQIELVNQGGDASVMEVNWNLVITGNPGTGKTTLARLVYKFFRAYGVLSKDVFEECNGLELKGEYLLVAH